MSHNLTMTASRLHIVVTHLSSLLRPRFPRPCRPLHLRVPPLLPPSLTPPHPHLLRTTRRWRMTTTTANDAAAALVLIVSHSHSPLVIAFRRRHDDALSPRTSALHRLTHLDLTHPHHPCFTLTQCATQPLACSHTIANGVETTNYSLRVLEFK
jgi:hypothetical protein